MKRLELRRVQFMPKELEASVLYVSDEFGVAGHLCACGCGNKVITPLGPTGWTVREDNEKPTVLPSIGSWQLACRSHYWIRRGEIVWAEDWSELRIEAGRRAEQARLRTWELSLPTTSPPACPSTAFSTRSEAVPPQRFAGLATTLPQEPTQTQELQPAAAAATSLWRRIWRWMRARW